MSKRTMRLLILAGGALLSMTACLAAGKGDDVNFFLRNGALDVGVGGDMPAIRAAADLDVVVAALIQQGFTSIVAAQPMSLRQLRGKRVGYAFGSNAHYALSSLIRRKSSCRSGSAPAGAMREWLPTA